MTEDTLSKAGVERLQRRIRRYWEKQGYSVSLRTVPVSQTKEGLLYGIRSDMVNGMPTRKIA